MNGSETTPIGHRRSERRLKIAFAMINCNRRDGSARAVNEVAERLAVKHEVHLFARKAEDIDLSAVQWHPVRGPGWPEYADFTSYHFLAGKMLQQHRFDIVHSIGCNVPQADVITIQNIQPAKRRVLERLNKGERVSFPRRLTRRLYLRATSKAEHGLYTHRADRCPPLFLPVSRGTEAELRAHYDIGPARVRVIPNAADTQVFHPIQETERRAWRDQNGIRTDGVMLIFSGGEWSRKGLEDAIRAMAEFSLLGVQLFVAGDDPDRARYHHLTAELGLSNSVIFGGFRRDIPTALAAADVFLFPSWYEAFSLATIEAAACGLPIVATKINGTEDFIQPGVTGEFIEHDAKLIASIIRPLISDIAACRSMGENSRRLVEQNYTWDRVAKLTEASYLEYLVPHAVTELAEMSK